MNDALFNKLTTSIRQAKAIRAGTLQPSRKTRLTKEHPAAVRTRFGLTQEEFAKMIGVPLGTLRNWEQGHREPTGPAKALLIAAAKYPRQIADALGSLRPRRFGFVAIDDDRIPASGRTSLAIRRRNGRVRDRHPADAR